MNKKLQVQFLNLSISIFDTLTPPRYVDAAEGYRKHLDQNGVMLVTLGGAMSTAEPRPIPR